MSENNYRELDGPCIAELEKSLTEKDKVINEQKATLEKSTITSERLTIAIFCCALVILVGGIFTVLHTFKGRESRYAGLLQRTANDFAFHRIKNNRGLHYNIVKCDNKFDYSPEEWHNCRAISEEHTYHFKCQLREHNLDNSANGQCKMISLACPSEKKIRKEIEYSYREAVNDLHSRNKELSSLIRKLNYELSQKDSQCPSPN